VCDLGVRSKTDLMFGQLAATVRKVLRWVSARLLPPGDPHLATYAPAPTRPLFSTMSTGRQRAAWPPSLMPGESRSLLVTTRKSMPTSPLMCGATVATCRPRTVRKGSGIQCLFIPDGHGSFFIFFLPTLHQQVTVQSAEVRTRDSARACGWSSALAGSGRDCTLSSHAIAAGVTTTPPCMPGGRRYASLSPAAHARASVLPHTSRR